MGLALRETADRSVQKMRRLTSLLAAVMRRTETLLPPQPRALDAHSETIFCIGQPV